MFARPNIYLHISTILFTHTHSGVFVDVGATEYIYIYIYRSTILFIHTHTHRGVFVDVGATDGFSFSNTYFFERELNWYYIYIYIYIYISSQICVYYVKELNG